MARPRRTNYKTQEAELLQKLQQTLVKILGIFLALFILMKFFGPKVGSIFLIFSKYRNDKGIGDIVPPPVPQFNQPPEATNKDRVTLEGVTEPGATVQLFVNGPEKAKTTSDSDGKFTFTDIELNKGNNIIFAKATDPTGNESENSKTLTIVYDNDKPKVDILEPKDGGTVKSLNKRVMVRGKTNEEAEIKINGKLAIVNADNTFELLLGVDEGTVKIKVEAKDKAGNLGVEEITITYVKDS